MASDPSIPARALILQTSANEDATVVRCTGRLTSETSSLLKVELARLSATEVQPVLLDVKQTAVYLGRSEQSVQHLIFEKELPVVRKGRRVHLHRCDLDAWIEKNKY